MLVKFILNVLLLVVVTGNVSDFCEVKYRLSNNTEPVSYELWLETRIHKKILDYTGRVVIKLKVNEATDYIMLGYDELFLEDSSLKDSERAVEIISMEKFVDQKMAVFRVEQNLNVDQVYTFDIKFKGVLGTIPNGFSFNSFFDDRGETYYTATSHMHIANARKVFPCYDEPKYRTPFIVHITHHPSYHALSNMPVSMIVNNSDDYVTTTFEKSFPMPPSLLAFTVSNHPARMRFYPALNLAVNIFAPQRNLNELDFALDLIGFILEKLKDYLDMDISIPKLDGIIINDMLLTGLENWGLIFFNPKNFLFQENVTYPSQLMEISKTITHQLAHSYFGNLVGISWWNQFWMTEGFARYFEFTLSNFYLEDFPLEDVFCTDIIQKYFVEHSSMMSSSLTKYSDDYNDIDPTYDFSRVSKAAAVIRMIDYVLGRTTFQKGLQKYVKHMKFSVAEPEDLYKYLQEAVDEDRVLSTDIPVSNFLKSWTDQPGFPLLTVMRIYQTNEIVVNQQRFLSSREEIDTERLSWYIPLSVITASSPDKENTKPLTWIRQGTREIVLTPSENRSWTSEEWVLFNVQQIGYYRVNYDHFNWRMLATELHRGPPFAIGPLNRAQLIDDAFNLAYSDIVQFPVALDIIKYVRYEYDYAVWITANRHLLNLHRHLDGHSYQLFFGRFLQHLTDDHFERLDVFENTNGRDTVRSSFLRPIIVDLACRSGSGKCLIATRTMVTAEALTGHRLTPHEKPSVYYCHGLRDADVKTFQYFWTKLNTLTNEQEREHFTMSLGCYNKKKALYEVLLQLAEPSNLNKYTVLERYQLIMSGVRNGNSRVILEFLKNNHENIERTFRFNNRMEQVFRELAENVLEEEVELFKEVLDVLAKDSVNEEELNTSYRLNNSTEPLAYELWLETRIDKRILDYSGRVRILLKALQATNNITIHSDNLSVENFLFFDHFNRNISISKKEFKRETFLVFTSSESLKPGQKYVLDIKFTGHLQAVPRGFSYTRYFDEDGEFHYVASSFLHITNARKAFPCYDEPGFRSSFLIHMTHDPSMISASNMPVASISNNSDGTVTTTFQEMPSIPVNLVAFTVSNYETRKVILPNRNLELNFFVPKHQRDELDFAIDCISFMLNKFEEYLDVKYSLPKLDSVVINDLMHNGLENWGLMIFDSQNFLYKEGITTIGQTMDIVRAISHLMTHNYFGNLVGISWWNSFWMTEGFAQYFEYSISYEYLNDYPLNDIYVTEYMQRHLPENSDLNSNSLSKYVEARQDIENVFDYGLLSKASAIIRMSEHFLGKKTFQKGLQKYIRKMSLKSAEPKDLYESLQEAADEDHALRENIKIEDIFRSWTEQPGLPLVTVLRIYERNEIVINQQRFLSSREEHDPDGLSWFIPISSITASSPYMKDTKPLTWLRQGTREVVLTPSENRTWTSEDWVLFNVQQGYYRVNYDSQNWRMLAAELHRGPPFSIEPVNRAQLIDDVFSLAYPDIVSFDIALDIIKYVKYEEDYAVWVTANRHIQNMIRRLEGPSYEFFFGNFLKDLTENHFEKLDVFENANGKDSVRRSLLRPIMVDLACRSGSRKCFIATRTMVTAEALTGHRLTPREKPSVYYCHGLRNADEQTFRYFWKKIHTITNEQERTHITNSISCYQKEESLYELLLETADPKLEHIFYTNLERFQILINAVRNGHGKLVMHFLATNHENIAQTYTFNIRMEQAIREVAQYLPEEDHEEMINVLKILQSAGHISANMVERRILDMEYHRKWVEENKIKIEDWITEYFQPVMENDAHSEALKPSQNYVLDIQFSGHLQINPRGFCYTRYVDANGEFQYAATSFLYVTNARMAFPCYDEPRFRTSFLIHMTHDPSMMSASNMPVASITNNSDGTVTTTFQEMPSISVNLVAFTVSNYETRKVVIPNRNLELSFFIPKHQWEEVEFAMDFIPFMLQKFEEYLDVKFSLPKLDCVVVNDLMHTGLENWGLLVFESSSILFKQGLTSSSQIIDIVRAICHVMSHNYFGNLVGISWWNNAWLVEGFASYHEFYFSTSYFNDYPFDEIIVTDFIQRYLVDDSYLMSNALSTYGETRNAIGGFYGVAKSSKAAAVIRMCELGMFGKETFRKGLHKYIVNMSYKIAEPHDLYENLQEAIDEDHDQTFGLKAEDILKSWTEQPGYPLLTVMRNYQSNEIVVNQQRFLTSREEIDTDRLSWFIPLSLATARQPNMEDTKPIAWLRQGTRELVLTSSENRTWSSEEWVLFNVQQTGYYRVNYDTQNWKLLANELYKGSPFAIGVLNRAQLIDDAFNLAYSDVLQFPITLDILKYIRYEEEYAVWVTANRHLLTMIQRLKGPSYEWFFGRFLNHLTEDNFDKLDVFENTNGRDTVRKSLLRPIMVDLACRSGSRKCLIATRTMVTAEALTGHRLTPREKPSVYYCHGLRNADEKTFRYFWKKLHTITNVQERTHITNSIGCYQNYDSVYELLLETADPNLDSYYSNLERYMILASAFRNGHMKMVLHFLKMNHQAIAKTYDYNFRMDTSLIEIASGLQIVDHEEMSNVLQVLRSAGHISNNLVQRCMIDMEYHRKWVEENEIKIQDWINEYFQPVMENSAQIALLSYLFWILTSISLLNIN
ncbi:hypothetical protein DMENIID0001_134770 [Sergentomyia squamirostris]